MTGIFMKYQPTQYRYRSLPFELEVGWTKLLRNVGHDLFHLFFMLK